MTSFTAALTYAYRRIGPVIQLPDRDDDNAALALSTGCSRPRPPPTASGGTPMRSMPTPRRDACCGASSSR
jgi:hypothetical protein